MYNNQTEMKKFITKATALLSLFAVAACSEDALVENVPVAGTTVKEISITGKDFDFESATRSSVSITESGADFIWSENDTVGIFPNTGSQAEFAMSQGAGTHTATFTGGGWALKSSATYAAYYPYNFYNRDLKNIPVSYAGQTQKGNAGTAHIGAYDFMAASVSTPENGAVSFDMQHLGCLVQLTVDLDEAATINEVSIKYGEENSGEFITKGYIDLSSQTPAIQASSQEDKSNTISIALENFSVSAEETATVYFMMAPVNLEGKTIDVTVTKDNDDTKTYKTAGKNFIAGKAYAIALTDKDVLLTYNLVDLGLPSGTLWADRNVGADSPEASGNYFAWGETESKDNYNWSSYKWCNGTSDAITKYCYDSSSGTVDNKTVLDLDDDAAYVNMGTEWRMPTEAEYSELHSECTWNWTTQNGVNGYKVTGPNGNSIFLPAVGAHGSVSGTDASKLIGMGTDGLYWLSSVGESEQAKAKTIVFKTSAHNMYNNPRYMGRTVRAVVKQESTPKVYKVNLGLPSGTLWADRNVGADSPEGYGDYFAWGETEPKETYNWTTYKWCNGTDKSMTKYCNNSEYGTVDMKTVLDLEDDAAYVNMGTEWCMPTIAELSELNSECTWEWTTRYGVNGYKITGPNGNSIFFPAAGYRMESNLQKAGTLGYWWSSSLYEAGPYGAAGFKIDSNGYSSVISGRDCARTVRAVVKAVSAPKANKVDLGLPSGTLWADRNVGADSPEAYGDYFAWGETEPKDNYVWDTYKLSSGSETSLTKYNNDNNYGLVDNKTVLDLENDAAYVNMGSEWRMPTKEEVEELQSKCTWECSNQIGMQGFKVTGPNGNSIFLPAAGARMDIRLLHAGSSAFFWTSSLRAEYSRNAWFLGLDSNNSEYFVSNFGRDYGLLVRAVAR